MSVGPIDRFLSSGQLFMLYPAATLSVLQAGIESGSLHPLIDAQANQWFRGREIYNYLVSIGIAQADPVGSFPDAFVHR